MRGHGGLDCTHRQGETALALSSAGNDKPSNGTASWKAMTTSQLSLLLVKLSDELKEIQQEAAGPTGAGTGGG